MQLVQTYGVGDVYDNKWLMGEEGLVKFLVVDGNKEQFCDGKGDF